MKTAQMLKPSMTIHYEPEHPFVSRGGVKLSAALDKFGLSPTGCVCLDIGASTGGFTQVLLERGARRVYAIDVGHGQLHSKISADRRVISKEGLNARDLAPTDIPEPPQVITADVSFISLKLALPRALALGGADAWAVLLVKPQFELGRWGAPGSGVVKNNVVRETALIEVTNWVKTQGWQVLGSMESPIAGGEGNREYLLAARKGEMRNQIGKERA